MAHVTARKVVCFQWIAPNVQTGSHCGDPIVHNQTDWHLAESHSDHFTETHRRICDPCPKPKAKKVEKNNGQHKREQRQHRDTDKIKGVHIAAKTIGSEAARKGLIAEGVSSMKSKLCSGRDLNPHAFRHTPLKRTCLPFHHPSFVRQRQTFRRRQWLASGALARAHYGVSPKTQAEHEIPMILD